MFGEKILEIKKVGVVGCGQMGAGIAQISAMAGFRTSVQEVSREALDRGLARIENSLGRLVKKGKLTPEAKEQTQSRLKGTLALEDFADCDLIIEAVIENLDEKKKVFKRLDSLAKADAVFASNTSSLCITEMMSVTKRGPRFLGMHFFNPVPIMGLVEVVRTIVTDPAIVERAVGFAAKLGKTPIVTSDRAGFIVNRLLIPYLMDAVRALEEGFGSIEELDTAMRLGCSHPMGPLTLMDYIGNDTCFYIANILYDEYREERFAPPPLLKRMVLAGMYGRKTAKGFYDYSEPASPKPAKLL